MTTPLTPARLAAIKARTEAATDGPWWAWDRGVGYEIALGSPEDVDQYGRPNQRLPEGDKEGTLRREDAEFIAAARIDVPDLVAEVRALRASEAEVVTALGEANDARLRLVTMCRDLTAEVKRLRTGAEKVIGDYTRTAEEQRAGGDRDMAEMCEVVVMKIRRDILGGES